MFLPVCAGSKAQWYCLWPLGPLGRLWGSQKNGRTWWVPKALDGWCGNFSLRLTKYCVLGDSCNEPPSGSAGICRYLNCYFGDRNRHPIGKFMGLVHQRNWRASSFMTRSCDDGWVCRGRKRDRYHAWQDSIFSLASCTMAETINPSSIWTVWAVTVACGWKGWMR